MVRATLAAHLALFLALLVALTPVILAAETGGMRDAGFLVAGEGSGCEHCPTSDAERDFCKLICLHATLLTLTPESGLAASPAHPGYEGFGSTTLTGHLARPDPAPPKTASPA